MTGEEGEVIGHFSKWRILGNQQNVRRFFGQKHDFFWSEWSTAHFLYVIFPWAAFPILWENLGSKSWLQKKVEMRPGFCYELPYGQFKWSAYQWCVRAPGQVMPESLLQLCIDAFRASVEKRCDLSIAKMSAFNKKLNIVSPCWKPTGNWTGCHFSLNLNLSIHWRETPGWTANLLFVRNLPQFFARSFFIPLQFHFLRINSVIILERPGIPSGIPNFCWCTVHIRTDSSYSQPRCPLTQKALAPLRN